MTLQNRVLPDGEIVAVAARGMFTGNRGILHGADRRLGTRRWTHPHWLICTLSHPRGVHHGPMPARGWTALFFLDEAVALAAGHRPCAYCRRRAYDIWAAAWAEGIGGDTGHKTMDRVLHGARVTRARTQIRHEARAESLPDGAFIRIGDRPALIRADRALPFAPDGYGMAMARPRGPVTVLTPRPTLAVLHAGYAPALHRSAGSAQP
ncbi:MAG: hypothetical protein R3D84_18450 [Paracoccaceae bacterium]